MGHFSGLHRPQRWDQDLDRELTGDVSPGATQRIPAMVSGYNKNMVLYKILKNKNKSKNTIYGIFHPKYIIYGGQK